MPPPYRRSSGQPSPVGDIRILIVADDPLARAGLAMLLGDQEACQIVGQVAGQIDLVAEAELYSPDVILWDFGWDPSQGTDSTTSDSLPESMLQQLGQLKEADFPVVVLLPSSAYAVQTWSSGVSGLLPREVNVERLLMTLQAAWDNLIVIDPTFVEPLLPERALETPDLAEALTPRELEVLQLLAEGLANKAIAQRLEISDHTVKFHVNAIMTKLNAQSRTEAVVRATRLGLILL